MINHKKTQETIETMISNGADGYCSGEILYRYNGGEWTNKPRRIRPTTGTKSLVDTLRKELLQWDESPVTDALMKIIQNWENKHMYEIKNVRISPGILGSTDYNFELHPSIETTPPDAQVLHLRELLRLEQESHQRTRDMYDKAIGELPAQPDALRSTAIANARRRMYQESNLNDFIHREAALKIFEEALKEKQDE